MMADEAPATQEEPLSEPAGFRVSATEKRALRLVAAARNTTESELLREWCIPPLMEANRAVVARLHGTAEPAASEPAA